MSALSKTVDALLETFPKLGEIEISVLEATSEDGVKRFHSTSYHSCRKPRGALVTCTAPLGVVAKAACRKCESMFHVASKGRSFAQTQLSFLLHRLLTVQSEANCLMDAEEGLLERLDAAENLESILSTPLFESNMGLAQGQLLTEALNAKLKPHLKRFEKYLFSEKAKREALDKALLFLFPDPSAPSGYAGTHLVKAALKEARQELSTRNSWELVHLQAPPTQFDTATEKVILQEYLMKVYALEGFNSLYLLPEAEAAFLKKFQKQTDSVKVRDKEALDDAALEALRVLYQPQGAGPYSKLGEALKASLNL